MIWIGIHLQELPLDTLLRGSLLPEPCAVAEHERILTADRKASARGVRAGMLVSAALALVPQLRTLARDRSAETEALLGIAACAARFTPSVAIDFPDTLVLEVEGSLKLFGGLEKIRSRLDGDLAGMGYRGTIAAAPTARAAAWLARSGNSRFVDSTQLRESIEALPIGLLGCDKDTREALAALGISTLGALIALPRDGAARRFGPDLFDRVDHALGRLPDPRHFFAPPPRFYAAIELATEVAHTEALLFAANRLLAQLAGFLAARSGGVQHFTLRLSHREHPATEVAIGLVAPSRDAAHFRLLAREHLARLALREPVRAIALEATDIVPIADANMSLLAQSPDAPGDWPRLIERLRARLGNDSVHTVATVAEYRPERAARRAEPGERRKESQLELAFGERPFWLLEAPQALEEIEAIPHYRGPLKLLAGPERIESGWWDGEDVRRDYFIASTPEKARIWVFREPGARWYLHGVFS